MTSASQAGTGIATHRIDVACGQAGFGQPPHDVHLRVLPAGSDGGGWTLLAHSAPGRPESLARWIAQYVPIADVLVAPGLAPKVFRATMPTLPRAWALVAAVVKVHHLDLAADGQAVWFVEGTRDEMRALADRLQADQPAAPGGRPAPVRCRRVAGAAAAVVSRRQFEALSAAVAMGYYEIPHRIDLRSLAKATGVSLGSVSELLRRAEASILTHYVDSNLGAGQWPDDGPEPDGLNPGHARPLLAAAQARGPVAGTGWTPLRGPPR